MEVTCTSCKKVINIPDDKVPKGHSFTFACPACRNKIKVEAPGEAAAGAAASMDDTDYNAPVGETFGADSDAPGAMVCHTSPGPLKATLEKMGYRVHTPAYHIEAINNLRFNEYKVVVVTEEYHNKQNEQGSILEHLQNMMMNKRRKIYMVYIAAQARSYDNMEAFARSVNLIASKDDAEKLDSLAEHIRRGLKENEQMYKVFFEVQQALGKS